MASLGFGLNRPDPSTLTGANSKGPMILVASDHKLSAASSPEPTVVPQDIIRYPHNLHPICYLVSLHEAYHQASIWHNQIHLTSRRQIEIDFPGKYDDCLKDQWKELKFREHREWKRLGKIKLKALEKAVLEQEKSMEHVRKTSVSRHKFQGLLKDRMEKDWRRNYDALLNGPKGVAGNALEVLRLNGAPLISLDYLWDLLENPACDPPTDCLYYYPGQRLTRGNGHQQEPSLPNPIPVPALMDLPRYGKPLPIVLSPRDTDKARILALKQALETDVYAESIGNPNEPTVPTSTIKFDTPQFDGSSESRTSLSDYSDDVSAIVEMTRRKKRNSGNEALVVSFPEPGSDEEEYEESFEEFGVELLARILQNPKYLFEMLHYVDQEEQGILNTEDLIRGHFISSADDDVDEKRKITPDSMLEILSRSFVIPCSGYYHDVQEAVFRALMNKTKAVVDLVRPAGPGKTVNTNGTLLDDPKLREEVIQKRKELEEWMREVYVGAKLERIRSKKKYETRAQRWKVMWNSIVRDGKDADKILEAVKAPSVDHVLVEYITLNPRKRPYPGAPAPRLAFENDIQSELLQAQSTKNARPPTPPPRPRKTGFMDLIRESIANAPTFGFTQAPPPPQKPEADDGARNRVSKGNSNSKSSPEKNKKGHVDGAHDHDDHTNSGASRDHSPPILHMPKLEEDSDESLSHDHDVDLLDAIAALPFGMNGRYIPPISPPLPTPANEPEPEPEPEHSDEHGHHQPMEVHRRDGADGITHEEFRPKTLKRRGSSMKHPHIGWDVNGNLVDLSERKGEMHVKIVVPEEGCAPGAQPPEVHVGSRIRRGGVRRVNSFH